MNPVIEALKFRHACKKFIPDKKISSENLDLILDAAFLSPSSFGMEAWKFLVIESNKIRKALRPVCWNQAQVTNSSHVVVILAKPSAIDPKAEYAKQNFFRRNLPEDATQAYIDKYKSHMESEVFPLMSPYAWCSKQCYIALANIMTAAASIGIDTCPIEGFEKKKVEAVLDLDTNVHEVAVLVALGYRAQEQPPRLRHDKKNVIEYY